MLTEALAALAASGGTALVGAMATDAWQTARDRTARLFGRQGAQRQTAIEAQLDGNVILVERADDPDLARQALVPLWQMELNRLLEEHPGSEAELQELIAHVRDDLPAPQQRWVQNNIARDNSRQFAVQGGDIIYHESPSSAFGRQHSEQQPGAADDSSDSQQ
ncbi:hypothetical protein ABTZ21_12415 [Streptomyces sp. NPDC096191]|uniref:hypothetical protein n=1 Tax=Streptomyces sp. NPDC096191 TaxID=3155426 RepID=UPI003320AE0C